jgi:rhamnogalacturonan hydrolase
MSGNNNYVHDVSVENGDECVTVKTPTDVCAGLPFSSVFSADPLKGFVAENIECIYTAGCNIVSTLAA